MNNPTTLEPATRCLIDFLNSSPTCFHAVATLKQRLTAAGFTRLEESARWKLEPGQAYFVERNGSGLIAFRCGTETPQEAGFRLFGSHTDSPSLKIKTFGETTQAHANILRVEKYGGAILSTWLDRELTIAGRVLLRDKAGMRETLVNLRRPVAIIPNLAIHFNREVNSGFEYNPHTHLCPILAVDAEPNSKVMHKMLAEELKVEAGAILEADLYLCDTVPAQAVGANHDLITSGRIDNLAMCHAIVSMLEDATPTAGTVVGLFFDNEEVGSETLQGAASSFTRDLLERIVGARGGDRQDMLRAFSRSFLVSADMAHAVHPNFADKHDTLYAPILNQGPVIKLSASFRYATTARSAAHFAGCCEAAEVPVQRMSNRADIVSGSTIGPRLSALLGIPGVDVGNPMLAMHSIRETAGARDAAAMVRALTQVARNGVPSLS